MAGWRLAHARFSRGARNSYKNVRSATNVNRSACVYILAVGNDIYKIGRSKDFENRFKALSAANPSLKTIALAYVKDAAKVESKLHKKFKNQRLERELFELSVEDLKLAQDILDNHQPSHPRTVAEINSAT